jgi:hypothetical protein
MGLRRNLNEIQTGPTAPPLVRTVEIPFSTWKSEMKQLHFKVLDSLQIRLENHKLKISIGVIEDDDTALRCRFADA